MLPILIAGLLGVVLAIWLLSKGSKKKVAETKVPEAAPEVVAKAKAKPVLKKKTPAVEVLAKPTKAAKPAAKAKPAKKAATPAPKKAGKK